MAACWCTNGKYPDVRFKKIILDYLYVSNIITQIFKSWEISIVASRKEIERERLGGPGEIQIVITGLKVGWRGNEPKNVNGL